jgi:mannose-6-phosphate isomerase
MEKIMSNASRPALEEYEEEMPQRVYQTGDRKDRPWGNYIVVDTGVAADGEEYCRKTLTIEPLQILSLQSHKFRRETWVVKRGILTALNDGKRLELYPGESIRIAAGSIHSMANTGDDACVVEELQEGICREDDIRRYMDVYQRGTETLASPQAAESFTTYREILIDINKIKLTKKYGTPY